MTGMFLKSKEIKNHAIHDPLIEAKKNSVSNQTELITFIQYDEPPLKASEYSVTVTQTNNNTTYDSFTSTKQFAVSGERFSFQSGEIVGVFPPNLANGEFDGDFAHVLFSRLTLPWERFLTPDNDGAPWLAVLIFNEAEKPTMIKSKASDLISSGEKITVYGNPGLTGIGTLPKGIVSYPKINPLDYGETPDDECYTIDISTDLFNKIAPSLNDIPYLAHIRQSSTAIERNNATITGQLAIVLANRIPQNNSPTYAYLVSLENMGPYLPNDDGTPSGNIPQGNNTIRLICYRNWQFTANTLDQNLQKLLENLNKAKYGPNTFSTLQYPVSDLAPSQTDVQSALSNQAAGNLTDKDAQNLALNALSLGYTPHAHTMRHADKTVSWYRGPLVPMEIKGKISIPISCADAANRYDPETGLFDVSYGAAWELGRLIALQNNSYAVALYQWKKNATNAAIAQAEQELLLSRLQGSDIFKTIIDNRSVILKDPIPVPDVVMDTITKLHLLNGVPFNYLVADENMLPLESLRFFYLDKNWINALIDGAFSIGRSSTKDFAKDQKWLSEVQEQAILNVKTLQKNRKAILNYSNSSGGYTGCLLRSEAVAGWPNLLVNGYADKDGTTEIPLLRSSLLSQNIRLVIFDGIIEMITIHEPPEQLHCGVEPAAGKNFTTTLRQVTGSTPGKQYTDPSDVAAIVLRDDVQTLKIKSTAESIRLKLNQLAASSGNPPIPEEGFTSAEYALEMSKGAVKIEYVNNLTSQKNEIKNGH